MANAAAADLGKPLDGVRVLALEQMQALPYATQLLSRLGADVVKIESPHGGDLGRGSSPAMTDPEGRRIGATFLRNNLNKRTMCIDLRQAEGRQLVLDLAKHFDVVAENSKAGSMAKLGLSYEDVAAVHPEVIYLSVSGFGNRATELGSPYRSWPAFAPVVEAMCGIYEIKREGDNPPPPAPVGALGDIGAALYATIGILAALRQRERDGQGLVRRHRDVRRAGRDDRHRDQLLVARPQERDAGAADHARLPGQGRLVHHPGRPRGAVRQAGLADRASGVVDRRALRHPRRAGSSTWRTRCGRRSRRGRSSRDKIAVCDELGPAGIAAGPCFIDEEVVVDEHVRIRNMLVEMPRTDGEEQPVLVPGNPVKISTVAEGPETRVPWLGEHTAEVLGAELGLDKAAIADLRRAGHRLMTAVAAGRANPPWTVEHAGPAADELAALRARVRLRDRPRRLSHRRRLEHRRGL